MSDMTNKQTAESLRRLPAIPVSNTGGLVSRDLVLEIADQLDPKPKFRAGMWVLACDVALLRIAEPCVGRPKTWRLSDGSYCDEANLTALDFDIPGMLRQYLDGKLISTAGLPELQKGRIYTGEFREPNQGECFLDKGGNVQEKLVTGEIGMALIVGWEEAPNAHH